MRAAGGSDVGAVVRHWPTTEESPAEAMSRQSLVMDTVGAAQSLRSGAHPSSDRETSEWSQMTPRPVADGLVMRHAETGAVVTRARRLSPSVYVASAVLIAERSCCRRKVRTSKSS